MLLQQLCNHANGIDEDNNLMTFATTTNDNAVQHPEPIQFNVN